MLPSIIAMNELILNLKIIGKILIGFLLGLLALAVIIGIISFFVFPEDEILTRNINDTYYYTEQTSGWAKQLRLYMRSKFTNDETTGGIVN